MARNLMARDEMRNLGFWDEDGGGGKAGAAAAMEGGAAAGGGRERGGRVDVAEGKDPTGTGRAPQVGRGGEGKVKGAWWI